MAEGIGTFIKSYSAIVGLDAVIDSISQMLDREECFVVVCFTVKGICS